MSVFQETIWALWISHGRHSQTSIKQVDTLSGVLLTRLKNWSKLIELQGPESLYNLPLCCSALAEAAQPNWVEIPAFTHLNPAVGSAPRQELWSQNGWCAGCAPNNRCSSWGQAPHGSLGETVRITEMSEKLVIVGVGFMENIPAA